MRYIGSGMTARRAVSAPPVTAEPHLNSLFKAAHESSRVGVMGQIRRAKTAVASKCDHVKTKPQIPLHLASHPSHRRNDYDRTALRHKKTYYRCKNLAVKTKLSAFGDTNAL